MLLLFQQHASDALPLNHKITFDGPNKVMIVNAGITELDVDIDIYSDWKEWLLERDNSKYEQAIRTIGGDPTIDGDFVGGTYFLVNGWKIRTWEGDHQLVITGNLYSDDFGLAFFNDTLAPHNIIISQRVSNLIDKISTGGGLSPGQEESIERIEKDSRFHTVLLLKQNSKP